MARQYRKYRRRNTNPLDEFLGLAVVGVILLAWSLYRSGSVMFVYLCVALGLLVALVIGLVVWRYRKTQHKLRALDIAAIDSMDPLMFEEYVAKLLKNEGFNDIRLTERYDYGIDIIARKDNVTWGVQVKRYSGLVKAEAVRQVVTALIRYKCDRSMVVSNSVFSRPARGLAADNSCVLVGRDELSEWIVRFQDNK